MNALQVGERCVGDGGLVAPAHVQRVDAGQGDERSIGAAHPVLNSALAPFRDGAATVPAFNSSVVAHFGVHWAHRTGRVRARREGPSRVDAVWNPSLPVLLSACGRDVRQVGYRSNM